VGDLRHLGADNDDCLLVPSILDCGVAGQRFPAESLGMLVPPEVLVLPGPPPQAVLDKRWLWNVLTFLLGMTVALRLIGLDIAGALLTALMLFFAVVMSRDAMQEMSKYAMVYAVLCGLNFFFDVLPLLTEMGGRVSRVEAPTVEVSTIGGTRQTTYALTTKVTPFFSGKGGIVYNAQSLSMILSPICMALGCWLAMSAQIELQRQSQGFFFDSEATEDLRLNLAAAAEFSAGGPRNPTGGGGTFIGPGHSLNTEGVDDNPGSRQPREREGSSSYYFSGTPRKL